MHVAAHPIELRHDDRAYMTQANSLVRFQGWPVSYIGSEENALRAVRESCGAYLMKGDVQRVQSETQHQGDHGS
jgi:hypothetical protein